MGSVCVLFLLPVIFSEIGSMAGAAALCLFSVMVSSHLAMNFTGSTPFTSLSGVEREMRRGLPVQLLAVGAAAVLWAVAPFIV